VRAELIAQLTEHAVTDELTGLPNRRAWYAHLEQALARSRRRNEPLSLVLLDLDGFKEVNDQQGHAAGDRLLVEVTAAWRHAVRPTDVLGRLGGDEFAAVLECADQAVADTIVERLREVMPSPHRASAGVAVWDGQESAAELLARADGHMYERKAAGRSVS
jgi:diguanylate cyclase (GGDEF)-like protein